MRKLQKIVRRSLAVAGVLLLAIQLVPYGRDHANPAVRAEPAWNSPGTRELAVRACYDCHSNQTEWPWYSWIAPVSWLVQYDVDEGRRKLNFSAWDQPQKDADEAADEVREGAMPLRPYVVLHPHARLSTVERAELEQGLAATLGTRARRERDGER